MTVTRFLKFSLIGLTVLVVEGLFLTSQAAAGLIFASFEESPAFPVSDAAFQAEGDSQSLPFVVLEGIPSPDQDGYHSGADCGTPEMSPQTGPANPALINSPSLPSLQLNWGGLPTYAEPLVPTPHLERLFRPPRDVPPTCVACLARLHFS